MPYRVRTRNPDGSGGQPVNGWTSLELLLRGKDVGSITVSMPADDPAVEALDEPGAGLIVRDDYGNLISGPVDNQNETMSGDAASSTYTLTCPDDLVELRNRIVWPAPTLPWTSQPESYDVRTGPAETVLRGYVAANTTTTAGYPPRRTGMTQTADQGRGATVVKSSRFISDGSLLTLCQVIAEGGGLGFRAVQGDAGPVFDVYAPQDRSVVFSYGRGNLLSWDYTRSASPTNWYGMRAGNPPASTILREWSIPESITRWNRRVESYLDHKGSTDQAELTTALLEAAAANPDGIELTVTVADTEYAKFRRDYNLDDRVRLVFGRHALTTVIRQVAISVDSRGTETVTPTLGTPGAGGLPDLLAIRKLNTRLGRQEVT